MSANQKAVTATANARAMLNPNAMSGNNIFFGDIITGGVRYHQALTAYVAPAESPARQDGEAVRITYELGIDYKEMG